MSADHVDGFMPRRESPPTVLVFAYSCEPGKGSEPGAGWGMLMAIDAIAQPVVLMRPDSMPAVHAWAESSPGPHPEFIVVDEPRWASRLRKNRVAAFLLYIAWLRRAERVGREVVASGRIDLVHHITYSPYWLPTPAVRLGVPSILGPVGGAVTTPRGLLGLLGRNGRVTEWIDKWVVRALEVVPSTRRTWRAASTRVVQNRQTLRRIERVAKRRSVVFNHAVLHVVEPVAGETLAHGGPFVVWLSPMESRKGPELAIRAVAAADPSVHLLMVGDGPERRRMQELVTVLGIDDRVEFLGRVDHDRALALLTGATAAVFTGLREEGGLALAEAMYLGTPTIVLDHGGPSVIARSATRMGDVTLISAVSEQRTIDELADAMSAAMRLPMVARKPLLDRGAETEALQEMYNDVLDDHSRALPRPATTAPLAADIPPNPGDPLLSVVVAAYNEELFIGESIESVLRQTLGDIEVIVVDDGSSDRTWQIVQDLASADERIRPVRNDENLGVARSLNRGIALARAPLIGRLDADDVALPDRFERQVNAMYEDPELVVSGTFLQYINSDGAVFGTSQAGPTSAEEFRSLRSRGEPTMVMGGTAVMRKRVVDAVGGFDPDFESAEDLDLFSRMADFGTVVAIPEPLVLYRIHTNSKVMMTFFEGRQNHRLVKHRAQARVHGETPMSRAEFVAYEAEMPVVTRFDTRRQDLSQFLYRSGGLHAAEGRKVSAVGYAAAAGVLAPVWVVKRVWEQQLSPYVRAWSSASRS